MAAVLACALAVTFCLASPAQAVVLATPTPPMGWNPWYQFGCGADQTLVEQTAKLMASDGFAAAGYKYVNLDDCWMAPQRAADGQLQADPTGFPDGIPALAGYIHSLGLQLGVYLDAGTKTCQGRPGSAGHFAQDAQTLAGWGVDFVKVDYCNTGLPPPAPVYNQIYTAFSAVGRPIVLSVCDWGYRRPWTWAPSIASMWRTARDYTKYAGHPANFWKATLQIVDVNAPLAAYAHPGAWNDPDMLLVGTGKLTPTQERAQVSLWAIMASPMLMDAGLAAMSPAASKTLTNRDVIAVDQDRAGIQGVRIKSGLQQTWVRQLSDGSRVVLLFNSGASAAQMSVRLDRIGLARRTHYRVKDLWSHVTFTASQTVTGTIKANDIAMLRVWALPQVHSNGGVAAG